MWNKAERFLLKDRTLGPLVKKYGHCQIVPGKKKDYFVDLVDAITSQQLSGKAAKTIFERVQEKCGRKITPGKLKNLKTEELRTCGLSYAKCSYVKDLAEKVLGKKLQIKKLDKLSDEEVEKELIAVKGIGKWTAEMFLMFSLARPDIFPADDLGIKNGMKKLLKKGLKPLKIAEYAMRWRPYRTAAAWYIWKGLDNR